MRALERTIGITGFGQTLGVVAGPAFAGDAGALRPLCTDRPTKSTAPYAVNRITPGSQVYLGVSRRFYNED